MSSDEVGRDLASVQALMRKHDGIERDIAVLEDKVYLSLLADAHLHNFDYLCRSKIKNETRYMGSMLKLQN